jgi:Tfp pilus assembly protein PilF
MLLNDKDMRFKMKNEEFMEFFKRAMEAYTGNNFEESVELLNAAIENNPDFKLAYASRGAAYMRLNNAKAAIGDFDKAIELDGEYSRVFHLRGLAREKLGENDSALEDFDRAIELDPEYGAAYYSRATLLTKMGDEDRAVEDMEMVTHLTNRNIEEFANDNNVWRSQFLKLEAQGVASEMER